MSAKMKQVVLLNGEEMTIQHADPVSDLEPLAEYFESLPPESRNYLRYDVTDREAVRRRLEQLDEQNHWRLIGRVDGRIVAGATMDREPYGWTRHMAELRAVVLPQYEDLEIRAVLYHELAEAASAVGIERLFAEVLAEQTELIEKLTHKGFRYETTRKRYAKDLRGKLHDVIVLIAEVEPVWKKLADYIEDLDMQLPRIFKGA